ncbi:glycosyltransferase family 2 protein [Chitinispirillales bacterium ANBcel5]|uniref:glycosyltransferase family 2 protein n=1 Tax=Cellulosispirillum alkaliphilum TaxID=3039283 RepID=UPI002A54F000|nr:glycosyltransferase family 2 protein [Chitinispirillales bacterium ANBcel5]
MTPSKSTWPENLFILIPTYKSRKELMDFLSDLLKTVPREKICIVDDASKDGTEKACKDRGIFCIVHKSNQGKGAALLNGFSYLLTQKDARWILTMDADGQHSPKDLPSFLKVISEQPDVGLCIGARSMKPGVMPLARICSNRLTSSFLSLLTLRLIKDSQCGYRLYSSELLKKLDIQYNRFEMESEVILKAAFMNFPISFIQVHTLYLNGPSHISHFRDTLRWLKAVLHIWVSLLRHNDSKRNS